MHGTQQQLTKSFSKPVRLQMHAKQSIWLQSHANVDMRRISGS